MKGRSSSIVPHDDTGVRIYRGFTDRTRRMGWNADVMKHIPMLVLILVTHLRAGEIPNPAIDYAEFARLTAELQPLREKCRITEEEFLKMAAEPGTVILDARTKEHFDRIHIRGARHLAFTDFTAEELARVIPEKNTRILIYCNNNFDNEPVHFALKCSSVALNVQTFVNLHAYGYTNVRELGPLLDVNTTRIPLDRKPVPAALHQLPKPD